MQRGNADGARRHPPDVHADARMALAKPRDHRQERMHAGFIGANQHPAAAQVAQLPDR